MKIIIITTSIIVAILFLGWLGFRIRPRSFSQHEERTLTLATMPVPSGLPAPIKRFYRITYGDEIPVIETAVLKGRASLIPFGFKMPARFVFVHNAGKDYRHYIEATWFGIPLMKVNERYLDG